MRDRPTVLIAEDNCEWQASIARVLELQYKVLGFVACGNLVLAAALALRPDIITLDISMPGQSGLHVLSDLRLAIPDAAIVMLTTISSKLYLTEAYRRGASGYVQKVKVRSDLVPAIQHATAHGPPPQAVPSV